MNLSNFNIYKKSEKNLTGVWCACFFLRDRTQIDTFATGSAKKYGIDIISPISSHDVEAHVRTMIPSGKVHTKCFIANEYNEQYNKI